MKKIELLLLAALIGLGTTATAQFSQLGPKNEFMLKIEAGYAPYMGNVGAADYYGYYLPRFQNGANLNVVLGANISQDWFVGGGIGLWYYHNLKQKTAEPYLGATVFADFDFRPIWHSIMGLDYQPTSIKWAPMVGARVGVSALNGSADHGLTITPYFEVNAGANWYYWYALKGMRNMERTWHSFYATVGIAYMQQTILLPIRIGWRW